MYVAAEVAAEANLWLPGGTEIVADMTSGSAWNFTPPLPNPPSRPLPAGIRGKVLVPAGAEGKVLR